MGRRTFAASWVATLSLAASLAAAQAPPPALPVDVAAAAAAAPPPELSTGEVVAPPLAQNTSYVISPRGMRVATVAMKGSRFVVMIDGVEGEQYDEILNTVPELMDQPDHRGVVTQVIRGQKPVAFSPDGKRYAYTARAGKDVVVIVDGKEVYRQPMMLGSQQAIAMLSFTPDSKRPWFFAATSDTFQSFKLMMDGREGPAVNTLPVLRFSPDGTRYAYSGELPRETTTKILVVDGKQQDYAGTRPHFTPDGKKLVSLAKTADGRDALLVDGKALMEAATIDVFEISASGDIGAIARGQPGDPATAFYLNGKKMEGTDGAQRVVFSPDGKRWAVAALAAGGQGAAAVIDGKRGQDYQQGIEKIVFTADSSKSLYIASAGNKKFVVVDGRELPCGAIMRVPLTISEKGSGWCFVGGDTLGQTTAYANGKSYGPMNDIRSMFVSPDGSRHVFMSNAGAFAEVLFIDGEKQPCAVGDHKQVFFSPDGKHILAFGRPEQGAGGAVAQQAGGNVMMYLDGQFVPYPPNSGYPRFAGFTPDGKHLVWSATGPSPADRNKTVTAWFVDGRRLSEFDQNATMGLPTQDAFEMNADGTTTVLGRRDGQLYRVVLAAPAGSDVASMPAEAKAAAEKVIADAAEAKADKEAADAAAKAEAQKKYEEQMAAQKAAREKALAERQKAREDALAARKKAADEAAAKKAAQQAK